LPTTIIVTVTVVVDRRQSTVDRASSLYHTKLVASLSVVIICPSP
jgi:hypothetical protein